MYTKGYKSYVDIMKGIENKIDEKYKKHLELDLFKDYYADIIDSTDNEYKRKDTKFEGLKEYLKIKINQDDLESPFDFLKRIYNLCCNRLQMYYFEKIKKKSYKDFMKKCNMNYYKLSLIFNEKELNSLLSYLDPIESKEDALEYLINVSSLRSLCEDSLFYPKYEFIEYAIKNGWKMNVEDFYHLLIEIKEEKVLDFAKDVEGGNKAIMEYYEEEKDLCEKIPEEFLKKLNLEIREEIKL